MQDRFCAKVQQLSPVHSSSRFCHHGCQPSPLNRNHRISRSPEDRGRAAGQSSRTQEPAAELVTSSLITWAIGFEFLSIAGAHNSKFNSLLTGRSSSDSHETAEHFPNHPGPTDCETRSTASRAARTFASGCKNQAVARPGRSPAG